MRGKQFQYEELWRPISPRLRAICSVRKRDSCNPVQTNMYRWVVTWRARITSKDQNLGIWGPGPRDGRWIEERRGGSIRRAIKIGGGGMHDVCENRRCQLPACQLPLPCCLPPSSIAGTRATSPCEDLLALFAQNAMRLRHTIAHQLHHPQEREGSPLD